MKSKKYSIKGLYFDSWNYLKSCKTQIYLICFLFFVFALVGFFLPLSEETMNLILEYINQVLEQTKDMSVFQLISFIFLNNLQASFIGLAFGLLLGIAPVLLIILNGYVLGFVASLAVGREGLFSLVNLLPHGIFELPAVFISLGLGLNLGAFLFSKHKKKFFEKEIIGAFQVFLLIVIPLLIIAAIIEGSLIILLKIA